MFAQLIEALAVKATKAVRVFTKAAGHPVENNANAFLVAGVNKMLKLIGRAKTRRRRIISRYLIAPRAIKWVLHNGHNFDVRVAHLFYIRHQLACKVVIAVVIAAARPLPVLVFALLFGILSIGI